MKKHQNEYSNDRRAVVASVKKLVAVDLTDVIDEYKVKEHLYPIYEKFPLNDIIANVLSVSPYIDYSESIEDELDRRFGSEAEFLDMDAFCFFYESLSEAIDTCVLKQMQKYEKDKEKDLLIYVFVKWVDNTSLLLNVD